jgi:hypothetical protein
MTCSPNPLPAATPSASIPSPSWSAKKASPGLPRRSGDERPVTLKPEIAAAADVRRFVPRFLPYPLNRTVPVCPLLARIDPEAVAAAAHLPGSQMIPAAQAVRGFLALKLIFERQPGKQTP